MRTLISRRNQDQHLWKCSNYRKHCLGNPKVRHICHYLQDHYINPKHTLMFSILGAWRVLANWFTLQWSLEMLYRLVISSYCDWCTNYSWDNHFFIIITNNIIIIFTSPSSTWHDRAQWTNRFRTRSTCISICLTNVQHIFAQACPRKIIITYWHTHMLVLTSPKIGPSRCARFAFVILCNTL